ncbi:hypothetical protein F4677DRAFT_183936 [Hypoxylon crocopeplum]|nr:hypothetical protein F4677DRAFT_183936 [Hypoxylon crocopeplum]
MEHIRGYLKRLMPGKWSKEPNLSSPPALPSLPEERLRPLTATAPSPAATANSQFFQSLPPEIRHRILIEAFGERTLHLDLRLEHPLKKDGRVVDARPKRHANAQLFHPSLRDTSRRREWTWWSSECHHRSPSRNFHRQPPGVGLRSEEPALDHCRDPSGLPPSSCELYPGRVPDKCFIGVGGWLLACRQAYVEGVHVLYSTNRFHIAYAELALRLPRLLPPEHVAAIREIELSWSLFASSSAYFHFHWDDIDKDGLRDGDQLNMLERLPQVFPNLRYLYLSLEEGFLRGSMLLIGGRKMYAMTEEILQVIDAVVGRISQLRECCVALPSTLYHTRKLVEKGHGIAWHRAYHVEPEALWKNLPTTDVSIDLATGHQPISGYWIVHGREDMQPPPLPEAV